MNRQSVIGELPRVDIRLSVANKDCLDIAIRKREAEEHCQCSMGRIVNEALYEYFAARGIKPPERPAGFCVPASGGVQPRKRGSHRQGGTNHR